MTETERISAAIKMSKDQEITGSSGIVSMAEMRNQLRESLLRNGKWTEEEAAMERAIFAAELEEKRLRTNTDIYMTKESKSAKSMYPDGKLQPISKEEREASYRVELAKRIAEKEFRPIEEAFEIADDRFGKSKAESQKKKYELEKRMKATEAAIKKKEEERKPKPPDKPLKRLIEF